MWIRLILETLYEAAITWAVIAVPIQILRVIVKKKGRAEDKPQRPKIKTNIM